MLEEEIATAKRLVKTDAYQMSIGEIVSMYDSREIVIDPEFQRLFRWNIGQKSKLIESILLGIPLPSIFVFENSDGAWELIDGLQRVSTILEFLGRLRSPEGTPTIPSILESTKYLPSLHNTVWELSSLLSVPENEQFALDKPFQLAVRRSRIGVEILKRPSDELTKFELFQRLNAGGTQANPQELQNCIILMINPAYFRAVKIEAGRKVFTQVLGLKAEQIERQRDIELAVRFLVHTFIPYDGKLDVEEYIDEGIITLARSDDMRNQMETMAGTFRLISEVGGNNILRRFDGRRHSGKVGLVALECIAVGVAKNLAEILKLNDPYGFVRAKVRDFWSQKEAAGLTSPGLRGTTRIQKTVPFGQRWFKP